MAERATIERGPDLPAKLLKRESLRRQLNLLHEIRDRMLSEPADWYEEWSAVLIPLTDKVIHALMELEGVPPYPHAMENPWWKADVNPGPPSPPTRESPGR